MFSLFSLWANPYPQFRNLTQNADFFSLSPPPRASGQAVGEGRGEGLKEQGKSGALNSLTADGNKSRNPCEIYSVGFPDQSQSRKESQCESAGVWLNIASAKPQKF